jgi:hypothetical protein
MARKEESSLEDKNTGSYGVVTEQGDLGLGFNPLTEEEKKVLAESKTDKNDD